MSHIGLAVALVLIIIALCTSVYNGVVHVLFPTVPKGQPWGPTSGGELPYNPLYWNNLKNRKKLNCYDYAFGNTNPKQHSKSQPGQYSGARDAVKGRNYTCDNVLEKVRRDHPETVRDAEFEDQCERDEYKIALMVAPKNPIDSGDYHFMRQNPDGLWSHKSGKDPVTMTDGLGYLISAPHEANRHFGIYNYSNMCGYYCVKKGSNSVFLNNGENNKTDEEAEVE